MDISESFCRKPLIISRIYALDPVENQTLSLCKLEGDSKIETLISADSRQMILHGTQFKESIRLCPQIAQMTDVYKLSWPRSENNLDALVTAIENEITC